MSRAASLLFAIICYAIFFATFLYLIVFVGGFRIREEKRRFWHARRAGDGGHRRRPADRCVRAAAQRDGAPELQALVVTDRPAADRAQRLCAVRKHRADDPLHILAADRHNRVDRRQSDPPRHHMAAVLDRLGNGPAQHVPDQSFRTVRPAAGLVPHAPPRRRAAPLSPAFVLQMGARIRSISVSCSPSGPRRR